MKEYSSASSAEKTQIECRKGNRYITVTEEKKERCENQRLFNTCAEQCLKMKDEWIDLEWGYQRGRGEERTAQYFSSTYVRKGISSTLLNTAE
jgi:hypothetical protein